MKRLAIVLGLVVACSGGQKTSGSGSGSGGAIYAKKISLGWGFQANGNTTDVFLQTTDETGNQVSVPLGNYAGACKAFSPAAEMKALTGAQCTGVELHAVVQDGTIIILKLKTDQGGTPDPMAREEVTRVKAPGGAAIEAGT